MAELSSRSKSSASASVIAICFIVVISWLINFGNATVNDKEKELVGQLRPLVADILYEDYMKDDDYLVRFLRARNYDIQRAKEMIQNVLEWRKKNNIDTILLEDFGRIEKEFKLVFDGSVDKIGRPITIGSMKGIDGRKIALSGQVYKYLRLNLAFIEAIDAGFREMNLQSKYKNITHGFGIFDLAGFNLRQHACIQCLRLIPEYLPDSENNYPDLYHWNYIINAPGIFVPVFEFARSFFSPLTEKTIKLFDQNSHKWKQALLEEISPDQLPVVYGGTKANVIPTTFSELRQKNPFVKAAYEKILAKHKKPS